MPPSVSPCGQRMGMEMGQRQCQLARLPLLNGDWQLWLQLWLRASWHRGLAEGLRLP